MITQRPYVFYRSFYQNDYEDLVVVGLNLRKGTKTMDVSKIFKDGEVLQDAYSGQEVMVKSGKAKLNSEYSIVLLEKK
jgi:alpha-amylase